MLTIILQTIYRDDVVLNEAQVTTKRLVALGINLITQESPSELWTTVNDSFESSMVIPHLWTTVK